MFERFTERARQVVILAQEESRLLKHNYIGTEHVLLGLLREEEGLGCRALESFDVTVGRVRVWIIKNVGTGEEAVDGQIPFTPRAKKSMEMALREALSLGHNYIGTEHLLLGLIRDNEGMAMRYLREKADLDAEKIRNEVIRMLSGPKDKKDKKTKIDMLRAQIIAASAMKEKALVNQEFSEAADFRDRERRLRGELRELEPHEPKKWVVYVGGVVSARYARRPEYKVCEGGVVQIGGELNEPIFFGFPNPPITIEQEQ